MHSSRDHRHKSSRERHSPDRKSSSHSSHGESNRHRSNKDSDRHRRRSPSPKKSERSSDFKMPTKTLSGKTAGLSDAKKLRIENELAKKKEAEMIAKLSDDVSGRGAKTVFRDKSGKIRDIEEEERRKQKEDEAKAKAEAERLAVIKKFSVGTKQTEEKDRKVQEMLHEMEKPLARYKDDEDLDKLLREKEIEDDPMLEYMRKQKAKKEAKEKGEPIRVKPKWKGAVAPPPNRFNIWPGFRWDGVDRSNGYEKKFFDKQAEKVAVREEAYRWSTADM